MLSSFKIGFQLTAGFSIVIAPTVVLGGVVIVDPLRR